MRLFIVAPKGVYDNWVKGEIPTHLPDDIERHGHAVDSIQLPRKYQDEMKEFMYGEFRRPADICDECRSVVHAAWHKGRCMLSCKSSLTTL